MKLNSLVLIGLPTLIDQVLISNAKRMRSATAEGGGRISRGIVALQQNLKNLGYSAHALHVELDRSRKYYDLLRQSRPEASLLFPQNVKAFSCSVVIGCDGLCAK